MRSATRDAGKQLLILLGCIWCAVAHAQTPAPAALNWQAVARWPNLMGGMWFSPLQGGNPFEQLPPLKPELMDEARLALKETLEGTRDNRMASCQRLGVVGLINLGFPTAVLYSANAVLFMTDTDEFELRYIYLDARDHEGANPSPNGHSIGHWEGDTLVVDTATISPDIELAIGIPIGESARITERIRMTKPDVLERRAEITSPALSRPWVIEKTYLRRREWQLDPTVRCAENNRLHEDAAGKLQLDLRPPK